MPNPECDGEAEEPIGRTERAEPTGPTGPTGPTEPTEPNGPIEHAQADLLGRRKRPIVERLGMAAIAVVLGGLFGIVAAVAWSGGEPFLAAMGATGCLMTLWVGALTLVRG